MKIETKFNVGDHVYFIKDGQIVYAPINEIRTLSTMSSPHYYENPNTLQTEIVYVFIKWVKPNNLSNYTEEKERFELGEKYCFSSTDELISQSKITNRPFNTRDTASAY
jgi:hypothetical protein